MRWECKKISFIAFYNWRKIYEPNFQRTSPKKTPPPIQMRRANIYRCPYMRSGSYTCRRPYRCSRSYRCRTQTKARNFSAARFKIRFGCRLFGILQLAAQGSQPYAANASALSDRMRKITLKDTRLQLPQFQNRSTRGCKRQAPLFSP